MEKNPLETRKIHPLEQDQPVKDLRRLGVRRTLYKAATPAAMLAEQVDMELRVRVAKLQV